MKAGVLAIVGGALLVAAFAAFAPATLVDRRVAAASGGKLRVVDAEGTVWNGRGALADASGAWRLPVAWAVEGAALARGALVVAVSPAAGASSPSGTLDLAGAAVALHDVGVEVPAGAFARALPVRVPMALGGTVAVTAADFTAGTDAFRGGINARWRDARVVTGGTVASLGTVDLALAPQDGRLAGRIANAGGDVRIDGTVTLTAASVGVDATVRPLPSAPEPVGRALAALGTPDGNGGVRVAWRGALR